MANCGPSYAVPSCASSPVVGFGSPAPCGYGGQGWGWGYGGFGGYGGYGGVGGFGGSGVRAASLGKLAGVQPSCINQIPSAEVVVQPPPVVMTIPGAILSTTGEPVSVGGNTPCAVSYGGHGSGPVALGWAGGLGSGALGSRGFGHYYGFGRRGSGVFGRRGSIGVGRRGSVCLPPC